MGFQILGLLLLALFYGCYFAKALRQRRKGIRTDQMGRGKTGLARGIEITLKIVTIAVPAAEVLCVAAGTAVLPLWARLAGTAVMACGVAVFALSAFTMGDSWRAGVSQGERTELVTGGVYRVSRNPAFLGFDLVYLGLLLMFFHPALLAVFALGVLMLHLQIVLVEEPFLASAFGEDYQAYRRKVRRYL